MVPLRPFHHPISEGSGWHANEDKQPNVHSRLIDIIINLVMHIHGTKSRSSTPLGNLCGLSLASLTYWELSFVRALFVKVAWYDLTVWPHEWLPRQFVCDKVPHCAWPFPGLLDDIDSFHNGYYDHLRYD